MSHIVESDEQFPGLNKRTSKEEFHRPTFLSGVLDNDLDNENDMLAQSEFRN